MGRDITSEEKARVLGASVDDQYDFLVAECARAGEVWVLAEDDRLATADDGHDGPTVLLVWPLEAFACDAAKDEWASNVAEPMALDDFAELCEDLQAEGARLALMHQADDQYFTVAPLDLVRDLRAKAAAG